MKKNEKKNKSKYGVFNGNTISQETIGVEKSLVVKRIELDEQEITIEKTNSTKTLSPSTMVVDEQTILNNKKSRPISKIVKWIVGSICSVAILGIIIFLILKFVM